MREDLHINRALDGGLWHHFNRGIRWAPHHHREIEFNLILSGRAAYVLGGRRYELLPNMLLWLFPRQEHVLVEESDDFEMWIAVFRPRLLRRICVRPHTRVLRSQNPGSLFCKRLTRAQMVQIVQLCRHVEAATDDPPRFNEGMAYLLLSAWESYARATDLPDGIELHPAVARAARYLARDGDNGIISADKNNDFNLNALADHSGLSRFRLSRLFKQQMGRSIVEFRNRQRLRRFFNIYGAGQRVTMLHAALRAGFNSYTQFYRVFCQELGRSPADYRRQLARSPVTDLDAVMAVDAGS